MQTERSWQDIRRQLEKTSVHPSVPHQKDQPKPPPARPKASTPERPFKETAAEVKWILMFVAAFSLVINVLLLVGPLYMMQVYDRVLTSGSLPTLLYLTLVAGLLILVGAVLEATRSRILVRLGGRLDQRLSGQLFARVMSQGPAGSDGKTAALEDLDRVRSFLTGSGLFFFFDAPWTPIFIAVIFLLHPMLAMVSLGGAIALFALAVLSEVTTRRLLLQATRHFAAASGFAAGASANADTITAMGMMQGLRRRWQDHYRKGLFLQAKASDRGGFLTAATKFVRPMLQVAILAVGAFLVLNQSVSAGAMIAASIMMGRALAPVEGAIGNWRNFVLARAAYGRLKHALDGQTREGRSLSLPRPQGALSVEQLVGGPTGAERPIFRGISFGLGAGQTLGIIGPSASGKSTLARFLVGALHPLSGKVRLDNASLSEWAPSELGPHVGYLAQNIELFDGTVAENIARFGPLDDEAIISAAQQADIHDTILRLPNGYETRLGPSGTMLSGGQRQRVGLARAIYGNPSFVVLDEPNSNLDGQGEVSLLATLKALRDAGTTLIIITHRPAILQAADKILVLQEGAIAHFGPRAEVLRRILYPGSEPPAETSEPLQARAASYVTAQSQAQS